MDGPAPNTADNLVHWIVDPQGEVPGNGMPRTGIAPVAARDAAICR
jgi:cytochrome c2